MDKIRILIADDHAIFREGLRTLISSVSDLELVGEAVNGCDVISRALELKPDVILMDLVMPIKGGLDAIGEIMRELPQARILVLTSFSDDNQVLPAIKAGATSYLLKDTLPAELLRAIRDCYHGRATLDPSVAMKLIDQVRSPVQETKETDPLSKRELEILKLIAKGFTNQQIADELVLSEWTVRGHVSDIFSKLHLSNRTQAALYAVKNGLVEDT